MDINPASTTSLVVFIYGVHRDGQGLLNWLDSFVDCSATGDQDRLQTELAEVELTSSSGPVPLPS